MACQLIVHRNELSHYLRAQNLRITGGPRSFDEDVDYDTSTIADKSWEDLKHRENSIADDDWRYYEFQGWH
jgi:hypothetical protein